VKTKVLVFTPTYNESQNIEVWLKKVDSLSPQSDILIVDDSSLDGTTQILLAKKKTNPRLHVIIRAEKSGIGSAHLLALKEAFNKNYDLLITLDADLSHDPGDIPRFIEASSNNNYVVGTRNHGGGNEMVGWRLVLSKGANQICRILLPTGLSEYTTAFRCYDRKAMKFLITNSPKSTGYAYFIELTELLHRSGLILSEIPIIFKNRKKGVSKIPNLQVLLSGFQILNLVSSRIYWCLFIKKVKH